MLRMLHDIVGSAVNVVSTVSFLGYQLDLLKIFQDIIECCPC